MHALRAEEQNGKRFTVRIHISQCEQFHKENMHAGFCWERLEERCNLEDLGIDGDNIKKDNKWYRRV